VLRLCACGCGEQVKTGEFKRGHFHRGRAADRPQPIPGPDDLDGISMDDIMDLGDIPVIEDSPPSLPPGGDVPPWEDIPPDEPPADLGKPRERRRAPGPAKVTAAVRKDVTAKIAIPCMILGKVWEARDPICGGAFVAQVPATAEAFAGWVCDSPDLLDWMTSSAGGFMHVLNILAALGPVATVVYGHHVTHTIVPNGQPVMSQPDLSAYRA